MQFLLKLLDELVVSREKMIASTHPKEDRNFFWGNITPWSININDQGEAWYYKGKDYLFESFAHEQKGGTLQVYFEYDSSSNIMRVSVQDLVEELRSIQRHTSTPPHQRSLFDIFYSYLYSPGPRPEDSTPVVLFDFRTAQPVHISKVLKLEK